MGTYKLNRQQTMLDELYFAPCLKCGSDNIEFGDCGYSSFNVAYGKCKDCKHEVLFNCGVFPDMIWIIQSWNEKNDIPTILVDKRLTLAALKKEISELEKKFKRRQKKDGQPKI